MWWGRGGAARAAGTTVCKTGVAAMEADAARGSCWGVEGRPCPWKQVLCKWGPMAPGGWGVPRVCPGSCGGSSVKLPPAFLAGSVTQCTAWHGCKEEGAWGLATTPRGFPWLCHARCHVAVWALTGLCAGLARSAAQGVAHREAVVDVAGVAEAPSCSRARRPQSGHAGSDGYSGGASGLPSNVLKW